MTIEITIKKRYELSHRNALKSQFCSHLRRLKERYGKLSDAKIFDVMYSSMTDDYVWIIDGKINDGYDLPNITNRTLANFYKSRSPVDSFNDRLFQVVDTYLQAQSDDPINARMLPNFERSLGQLTATHLSDYDYFRDRTSSFDNIKGVYLAEVSDLALLTPKRVSQLILHLCEGLSKEYIRVRLICLVDNISLRSYLSERQGKFDRLSHEYFGIGVITEFGINCHLRDHFFSSAYLFFQGSESWTRGRNESLHVRFSSQYASDLPQDDENFFSTDSKAVFNRSSDTNLNNNLKKHAWIV